MKRRATLCVIAAGVSGAAGCLSPSQNPEPAPPTGSGGNCPNYLIVESVTEEETKEAGREVIPYQELSKKEKEMFFESSKWGRSA
jgi:hypothetical protein